jgi:hypothetical protein
MFSINGQKADQMFVMSKKEWQRQITIAINRWSNALDWEARAPRTVGGDQQSIRAFRLSLIAPPSHPCTKIHNEPSHLILDCSDAQFLTERADATSRALNVFPITHSF